MPPPTGAPDGMRDDDARASRTAAAALVLVLLVMALLVSLTGLNVGRALEAQERGLAVDAAFGRAQLSTSQEALAVRDFRVDRSAANLARLRAATAVTTDDVASALALLEDGPATETATAVLTRQQASFAERVEEMIALTGVDEPAARQAEDRRVIPASFALQTTLDAFATRYHAQSLQQLEVVAAVHRRTMLLQGVGGVGAAFVAAVVLRMLSRYRRRAHELARTHEHAALHDALTGLTNREGFRRVLERAAGTPRWAVALVDLDGFKAVNDTFGHNAGDQVLVAAARALEAAAGPGGTAARLGGDEFGLLLSAAPDLAALEGRAAALSRALELAEGAHPVAARISGSVGLTPLAPDDDIATALHRADLAMYRAKTGAAPHGWAVDAARPDTPTPTPTPTPRAAPAPTSRGTHLEAGTRS